MADDERAWREKEESDKFNRMYGEAQEFFMEQGSKLQEVQGKLADYRERLVKETETKAITKLN